MLYDADIVLSFVDEIAEYLPQMRQHLKQLAVKPNHKEALEEVYRLAHTIKGSASMLELDDITAEGKTLEQSLLPVVEKKAAFTPALAELLLARVDAVEQHLQAVTLELSGTAQAAPVPTPTFAYEPLPDILEAAFAPLVLPETPAREQLSPGLPAPEWQLPATAAQLSPLPDWFNNLMDEQSEDVAPAYQAQGTAYVPPLPELAGFNANGPVPPLSLPEEEFAYQKEFESGSMTEQPFADISFAAALFENSEPPARAEMFLTPPVNNQLQTKLNGNNGSSNSPTQHEARSEAASTASPVRPRPAIAKGVSLSEYFDILGISLEEVAEPASAALTGQPIANTASTDSSGPQTAIEPDQADDLAAIMGFYAPLRQAQAEFQVASHPLLVADEGSIFDTAMATEATDPIRNQDDTTASLSAPEYLLNDDFAIPPLDFFCDQEVTSNAFEPGRADSDAAIEMLLAEVRPLQAAPEEPYQIPAFRPMGTMTANLTPPDFLDESLLTKPLFEKENQASQTTGFLEEPDFAYEISELGDLDQAVAALEEEATRLSFGLDNDGLAAMESGEDYSLGAFFLAEGQSDLDRLAALIAAYSSGPEASLAGEIQQVAASLRKAAAMMDLEAVAGGLHQLELSAGQALDGQPTAVAEFETELLDLMQMLQAYQAAADAILAPPVPQPANSTAENEAATEEPAASLPRVLMPEAGLDQELAEVFVAEAHEHIHDLDTRLAELEHDPYNRELIREIRRSAHTLKGSAAMVGLNVISQTGHLMEDLLDRLYDGSMEVSHPVVELLFETFNAFEALVRAISTGRTEDASLLETLRPHYALVLDGQPVSGDGAEESSVVLFDRVPPRPTTPQTGMLGARQLDDLQVEALEAAFLAETEIGLEEGLAEAVMVAPTASAALIRGQQAPAGRDDEPDW